jgi:hypothetical protein
MTVDGFVRTVRDDYSRREVFGMITAGEMFGMITVEDKCSG